MGLRSEARENLRQAWDEHLSVGLVERILHRVVDHLWRRLDVSDGGGEHC